MLHYFLDFGYTKLEDKKCSPYVSWPYVSKSTLQGAIEVCDVDNDCIYIQDMDSNGNDFRICKKDSTLIYDGRGSKIYQKPGKSMMLAISMMVT